MELISLNRCLDSLVPTIDNYHPPLELFIKCTNSSRYNNNNEHITCIQLQKLLF